MVFAPEKHIRSIICWSSSGFLHHKGSSEVGPVELIGFQCVSAPQDTSEGRFVESPWLRAPQGFFRCMVCGHCWSPSGLLHQKFSRNGNSCNLSEKPMVTVQGPKLGPLCAPTREGEALPANRGSIGLGRGPTGCMANVQEGCTRHSLESARPRDKYCCGCLHRGLPRLYRLPCAMNC